MTDIFFIAYQFPPLNIGGAFRPLKFVKYFNDFEIKPIIFTLSPENFSQIYKNKEPDYNLLTDIDHVEKEIINVTTDDLLTKRSSKFQSFTQIYFNLTKGSEHKKWKNYFFKATEQALLKYSPKVILVTAPPFGIVELAVKLSKKTGVPLIIDMRDSLSMWISQPYGSFLHYKFTLIKEKSWFNHAKKVIAVTQQMINDWKTVHPKIHEGKFEVIPNGYDNEILFDDIVVKPTDKIFTIGYVGSFYYNPESRNLMFKSWHQKRFHRKLQYTPRKEDWLYRSPFFLFKTLNFLFKNNTELKSKVIVKFAGAKPDWLEQMISRFGLNDNIEHLGFLPFEKIDKFQDSCNALLITSVKVIEGEDYCIAGKTFDYISSQKPILGFVTEGSQKEFIENSRTGIICDPDNIVESANILKKIFDEGVTLKPNKEFIEKHHRKYLTEKLAEIINSI
ncbi:MAG: glycosyltransferase [Bacteroidales bacterium]|nr:glycosyltransferase [Bacteroidales bacterium]